MADNDIQVAKASGSIAATGDSAATQSPKKDKGTDNFLDIFTTEEVKESFVGKLCKDLSDISIDSLLEQTKQVAEEIKWGR